MNGAIPEDFAQEFEALWHDRQEIHLEISKFQAWCLLSAVQLARRHPEASKSTVLREAENIVKGLEPIITTTPALARVARVARQGWKAR